MIQSNSLKMSRESRKLYEALGSLCYTRGVNEEITLLGVYLSDMIMIKYYSAPIINIIKMRAKNVKVFKGDKHGNMEYWIPMLSNMLTKNTTAVRTHAVVPDWFEKPWDLVENGFRYIISNYLLTDYGYDDMVNLIRIVNTYSYSEILDACSIGKSNNVYEIRYIKAVLEKESAKKEIVQYRRQALDDKIKSSDRLLDEVIHEHSVLDMAQAVYSWNKTLENAELEAKFNKLMKERGI